MKLEVCQESAAWAAEGLKEGGAVVVVEPAELARRFASLLDREGEDRPFFVMDTDQVVRQVREWRTLMPRVEPFYAVKCNNDPTLLRILADLGCNFDCASRGEIDQVLRLPGMKAERIIYANPCKTRSHIRHAAATGVRYMTFDNAEEMRKVAAVYPGAQLVLRIKVSDPTAVCQLNTKFGVEPGAEAERLLRTAADDGVAIAGVSFHVGSGSRDPAAYGLGVAHARRLVDLGRSLGHDMHLVDIGGGFPGAASATISMGAIAAEVSRALAVHFPPAEDGGPTGVRLIAEPGRYFAAAAFSLVCNIIAKTRVPAGRITGVAGDDSDGIMYYINDGVYSSFNCVLYDHYTPTGTPLADETAGELRPSAVWGPTCDGLDLVIPHTQLPEMAEGDWMLFRHMGAYTLAAGSEFNGFQRPAVFYTGSLAPRGARFAAADEGYDSTDVDAASSASSAAEDTDIEQN